MSVRLMLMVGGQSEPLTVSATNVTAQNSGFAACGNPGTTPATVTTVTHGSGSYTFLWQQVGAPADDGPFNCSSTTAQNPTWGGGNTCDGDDVTEDWQVTVTDLIFDQVATDTISVTRRWINLT